MNGASDPVSGVIALMEEGAVGVLAKAGWKPKRTIMFAAWDGEQALLGSTEWVEDHAKVLRTRWRQLRHEQARPVDVGGAARTVRQRIAQVVSEPKEAARLAIA